MAHLRIQSLPELPQELATGDLLVSKFLDQGTVWKKGKVNVFERLYRDGEIKRKAKVGGKEEKTRKVVGGIRPKIEDVLLQKYEDSKHNLELLRAKWDRHIMKDVFSVPRINPKSAELARRPAPYGGYSRCYAHENGNCDRVKKVINLEGCWKVRSVKVNTQRLRKYSELVPPEDGSEKEKYTGVRPAPCSLPISPPTSPPARPSFPPFSSDPLEILSSASSNLPPD